MKKWFMKKGEKNKKQPPFLWYNKYYIVVPPTLPLTTMVKAVRILLEEKEYERLAKYKEHCTWYDVLKRGIESIAFFSDIDWVDVTTKSQHYIHVTDEEGELK